MWKRTAQLPCWPPKGQQEYISCVPSLPSVNNTAHSGFETERKHHQKSDTGASVAPQKGLMSYKNLKKKISPDSWVVPWRSWWVCLENRRISGAAPPPDWGSLPHRSQGHLAPTGEVRDDIINTLTVPTTPIAGAPRTYGWSERWYYNQTEGPHQTDRRGPSHLRVKWEMIL